MILKVKKYNIYYNEKVYSSGQSVVMPDEEAQRLANAHPDEFEVEYENDSKACENLEEMSYQDLRKLAVKRGINCGSRPSKADLIAILSDDDLLPPVDFEATVK